MQRGRQTNLMYSAENSDCDRIDDRSTDFRRRLLEAFAIPRPARDFDKSASLGGGFELPLARRHERGCEFGDIAKGAMVNGCHSAMSRRQKYRVAKARSFGKHRSQPVLK